MIQKKAFTDSSSCCNSISVPGCPLFCFPILLLHLLLMLWFLLPPISGSPGFSTVSFSFISTPYFFLNFHSFLSPRPPPFPHSSAPSFAVSCPSALVPPVFSADLSTYSPPPLLFLPLSTLFRLSIAYCLSTLLICCFSTVFSFLLPGMQPDWSGGAGQDHFSTWKVVDWTSVLNIISIPCNFALWCPSV